MKRLMIVFAVLAAVACAKNNVAEDPAPAAQYLNLTISDFPALESATRSGETVGKTAWEDGDQLLIVFIKKQTTSYHIATYNNGGWSLDTPIPITEADLSNSYLIIAYQQGMKFSVGNDDYVNIVNQDDSEPTAAQLIQSEQLGVYNLVRSMDHAITFNKIVDENDQLVSSILQRTNRVRISYIDSDPSTKLEYIEMSTKSGEVYRPSSSGLLGRTDITTGLPGDVSIPLDENNEVIVYLYWSFYDELPPIFKVKTTFEQDVNLPYGENDGIDAPYPFDEFGFTNPIFAEEGYEFPYHSNAYAYSVILN